MENGKHFRVRKGFMLIDVLIGAFVLVLASLSLLTLIVITKRSEVIANDRVVANKISTRLIEHLQLLKSRDMNAETLMHLNLVDAGQSASPFSFTNIPLDDASNYSPSKALPNGQGTMTLVPLESNSVLVKINVSWRGQGNTTQSISTGTVIGGYR